MGMLLMPSRGRRHSSACAVTGSRGGMYGVERKTNAINRVEGSQLTVAEPGLKHMRSFLNVDVSPSHWRTTMIRQGKVWIEGEGAWERRGLTFALDAFTMM